LINNYEIRGKEILSLVIVEGEEEGEGGGEETTFFPKRKCPSSIHNTY
jgi:hypothetical protein